MKKTLLIEVGTEEMPAVYLRPAAEELKDKLEALLKDSRISFRRSEIFYTPRRLAVMTSGVARAGEDREEEIQGPPAKVAFDKEGKPTNAARSFADRNGVSLRDLFLGKNERGEYVHARKKVTGTATADVLVTELPGILAALRFPKRMVWGEKTPPFARPVRWLVGLMGDTIVPFEFGGVSAGRVTRGHRFLAPQPLKLGTSLDYEPRLTRAHCIVSFTRRRKLVESQLRRLADGVDAQVVPDPELLDEVTNLVEEPLAILCNMEEKYLSLPEPVLVTALRAHQRCFSVRNAEGRLLPHFIAVTNSPKCDWKTVSTWYERAAESRLSDASFYIEADRKRGLDAMAEDLKGVIWVKDLGTLYGKTERIRRLAADINDRLPAESGRTVPAVLDEAARLCKADLVSEVVREKEFTSLQGTMGGVYARREGRPAAVALAVEGHYRPTFAGGSRPETPAGSIISVADKLDNIVAAFVTGEVPTGSEDPFGLRRQATAIIDVIRHGTQGKGWDCRLREIVAQAVGLLDPSRAGGPMKPAELAAKLKSLEDFFAERLRAYLGSRLDKDLSFDYDLIDAVVNIVRDNPYDAFVRAQALDGLRTKPEFEKLVIGQKRLANILRGIGITIPVDESGLVEETEKLLYHEARSLRPKVERACRERKYGEALDLLLGLRPIIDKFFDDVLVMAEDAKLRANRLALVKEVKSLFETVADFSKIVLAGKP